MSQQYTIYTLVAYSSEGEVVDSMEMDMDSTIDEIFVELRNWLTQFEAVEIRREVRSVG